MKRYFLLGIIAVWMQPFEIQAQAPPYLDTTCNLSTQICSGVTYTYPAWYGNHPAQSGPYYGCLASQPDPAWFYFIVGEPGPINIYMYSANPARDIDFICWGPFDSLSQGCNNGLVSSKVVDCCYCGASFENCEIPNAVAGKYYILLICNFSKNPCTINLYQASGTGTMVCLQAPLVTSNSPLCAGQTIQLTSGNISGATYQWTGPNGFTSTLQNPVILNATTGNSGTYTLTVSVGSYTLDPINIPVTVNPIPVPQIIPDTSTCSGYDTHIGGQPLPGYTYTWTSNPPGFSSFLSNPMVNPTVNTSYFLTVTSDQGCVDTASTFITVKPLPYASVLPNTTVCEGATVPLGGPPNPVNTYVWSSNPPGFSSTQSNPTLVAGVTTTYTLTVTNPQGCSRIYNVVLTVNPAPIAFTGPDQSSCSGTSINLGGLPVSGNTYSWTSNPPGFTSGFSNPTDAPFITTVYTLTETISSTGCSKTNTVMVTVYPLPEANTGPNTNICLGNSITIGAPAIPDNTYSWTSTPPGFVSGLANPTVTPISTTTYHLTETSGFGCTSIQNVTVTVNPIPLAVTGPNTAVCKGSFVTLGSVPVTGNTYQWTSTPPGFTSAISNPQVYPNVSTTYTLTETISATSCYATNSVTVTVNPLPVTQVIPNTAVCSGNSISIGSPGTPGNTYQWTSNPVGFLSVSPNPQVTPVFTTTYILTQTITATGCTKMASVTITVNPTPVAFTGPDQTVCAGNQTTIGGPPVSGNSYSWSSVPSGFSSQVSNPVVYPSVTTTYTLFETHTTTGCFASNSVKITVTALPQVTLQPFSPVCKNAPPFALTGGFPPGGTYSGPGVTSNIFNPAAVAPGTYTIIYSYFDLQGCNGSAFQQIQVLNKPRILGSVAYLNIYNTPLDSTRIQLLSFQNIVLDSTVTMAGGTFSFNCLNPGTYKVKASCSKKWGGANSVDALLIARYSIGMISFSEMQKKAADVNGSGYVNAGDAYLVIRRFAGIINSFPAGDWCFESQDSIVVSATDVIISIHGLCMGDVNQSHIPISGSKFFQGFQNFLKLPAILNPED